MKIIVIKVLTSAVGGSKIRLLLLDVMDLLLLHALGIYYRYCGVVDLLSALSGIITSRA